ncbi:MAG: tRNA glutamyl-Q(34) synthetase GluQRS [Nitrosomonadales bacterium]|nr:tRNA glutamyl-Q(34) synthetase GluQRS [Nitrosomonadales bacterium]
MWARTKRSSWNSRKKLSLPDSTYRGRFAPSPTGPLHFGSLVAAVGSYLDARHHNGTWLVRVEDLDAPRCVPGAAEGILRTLDAFGLHGDEPILYQSRRTAAYEEALQQLRGSGSVYPCICTRKEIADSALHGIDGMIYPGTCRNGMRPRPDPPRMGEGTAAARTLAWRVRSDLLNRHSRLRGNDGIQNENGIIEFNDALQGHICQHIESETGDFVVKRADGLFAYQLAVAVDDAFQGVTDVVRGSDLLVSTPRQIYLQRLLGLPVPRYAHLPTAIDAQGEKLSKQTLATPVTAANPVGSLLRALVFLRQQPPAELSGYDPGEVLGWAIAHWDRRKLEGIVESAA